MDKPNQTELQSLGISQAYASLILRNERQPSRPLAIRILREFGWRHEVLDGLTDDDIATLERIEPWTPRSESAAS